MKFLGVATWPASTSCCKAPKSCKTPPRRPPACSWHGRSPLPLLALLRQHPDPQLHGGVSPCPAASLGLVVGYGILQAFHLGQGVLDPAHRIVRLPAELQRHPPSSGSADARHLCRYPHRRACALFFPELHRNWGSWGWPPSCFSPRCAATTKRRRLFHHPSTC